MSKVHDNSAPKMILGMCWGAREWLLAIPQQAWLRQGELVEVVYEKEKHTCQIIEIVDI